MVRNVAERLIQRLEREWRIVDPERQEWPHSPGEVGDSGCTAEPRRVRIGRVD